MHQSHDPRTSTATAAGLAAFGSLIGGGLAAWLMTLAGSILDLDNPGSAAEEFQGLLGTVGVAGVVAGISTGCWLALRARRHIRAPHIAIAAPVLAGLILLLLVSIGPDQATFPTLLVTFALGGAMAALAVGKPRTPKASHSTRGAQGL
jgi:hypothetical protein